ncbi:MAG: hypothetical protein KIT14_19260 [bacterium]|nr:hypothetical protein [bacterium]
MRRFIAPLVLVVVVGAAVHAEDVNIQQITPINTGVQQGIEVLHPAAPVQGVQEVTAVASQDVEPNVVPTGAERTAKTAGKVALGVLSAGVSLGAAAAMLMFL